MFNLTLTTKKVKLSLQNDQYVVAPGPLRW
jgi:hypothetical protein